MNTMNKTQTYRYGQTATALGLLLLAACGGGKVGELGSVSLAARLPANSEHGVNPTLGAGYNSTREEIVGTCFDISKIEDTGGEHGSFSLERNLNQQNAETLLDLKEARGRLGYGEFNANVGASVLYKIVGRKLSDTFVFKADYQLRARKAKLDLNQTGRLALAKNRWSELCGDEVVAEEKLGAKFFVVMRMDYENEDDRLKVAGDLNFNKGMEQEKKDEKIAESEGQIDKTKKAEGKENVDKTLNLALQAQGVFKKTGLKEKVNVRIEVHQWGGDVTKMTKMLGNGSNFVECSSQEMDKCLGFLKGALAYAADPEGGFLKSLREQAFPAYITVPYERANLSISEEEKGKLLEIVKQSLPKEVKEARRTLEKLFAAAREYRSLFAPLEETNFFPLNKSIEKDKVDLLRKGAGASSQYMQDLGKGMNACYSELDLEDEDSVADCKNTVEKLQQQHNTLGSTLLKEDILALMK